MNFEKFFRLISYAAVVCGFFSLWVTGTFGIILTSLFIALIVTAWFIEGSRWQISEKLGTALIVLALPAYYLAFKFRLIPITADETWVAGLLARLILSLTAIKLLQKKSDRDWIFLYLMAFFEMLLAAGLSISALYLVSFIVFLLVMASVIIIFEIRKTSHAIKLKIAGTRAQVGAGKLNSESGTVLRKLLLTAAGLITFTVLLAMPLFFILPRVGGSGLGSGQSGLSTYTGFSDKVKLGGIGRIQQSDEVVMRVRLEGVTSELPNLYWRGVALDTFDNVSWSKSKTEGKEPYVKGDRDFVQVDFAASRDNLLLQTFYLEPLDTPVLFSLSRAIAIQGNFPVLFKDDYGSISFSRSSERISYKVLSDRSMPSAERLRADNEPYPAEMKNYLVLPEIYDRRIDELTSAVTNGALNRYDKARAIESYLKKSFGYTLELKAGGKEPLADFLFNVRAGHCEYFATALAVMLRTQGIATRIVNGFSQGDYNETANMYVVRQKNAHSWVEVYFPGEKVWAAFDPTPSASAEAGVSSSGVRNQVTKYFEALEIFWIQYFVAYDNQEQASLARSVRREVSSYQASTSAYLNQVWQNLSDWWAEARGDKGMQSSLAAIGYAAAYISAVGLGILLFVLLYRRIAKSKVWHAIARWFSKKESASIVEFYDRLQQILADKGFVRERHQTPLEFAFVVGVPEAVKITEKYHRVRFGQKNLSRDEADEINNWLEKLSDAGYAKEINKESA